MIAEFTPQQCAYFAEHWWELSPEEREVIARRIQMGEVTPLPGSELPWQEWIVRYCSDAARYPLAPHHVKAWEWFDSLESGVRPPSLIAAFSRGHGKSTTGELGLVRSCVKGTRHFALYVKAALESANKHIYTIARRFEKIGIDRQLNKYGLAINWNAQQLTTENGFSVMSFGVDGAVRGIKLESFRPDLIIIDDIDELGDSIAEILKKIEALSNSILPTGSDDMAVAFLQNPQQPNSVMSQMLDGRADMLKNRITLGPIPALQDFSYEARVDPDQVTRYYILTGTPTWEGKPRDKCQQEIHDYGISAFKRECQHDIKGTGIFFTTWNEMLHVRLPGELEKCPYCQALDPHCARCEGTGKFCRAPLEIPSNWQWFGGNDYGRSDRNPWAFLLMCADPLGDVKLVHELYSAGLEPSAQARKIAALLNSYGLRLSDVPIFCDPSMFPAEEEDDAKIIKQAKSGHTKIPGWSMTTNDGKYIADEYEAVGLKVQKAFKANNRDERINGWAVMEELLKKPLAITVYKGRCPNFIREIAIAPVNPNDDRDVDTHSEEHLLDCGRFGLRNRGLVGKVVNPNEPPKYRPSLFNQSKAIRRALGGGSGMIEI